MKKLVCLVMSFVMFLSAMPANVVWAEELDNEESTVCEHQLEFTSVLRAATCTATGIGKAVCTICGESLGYQSIPMLEHVFVDYEVIVEASCEGNAVERAECIYGCGATDEREVAESALGHLWDEGTITVEKTCTEDQVKVYTCTRCEASYTETEESIGHQYSVNQHKDATCAEDGKDVYVCSECGDTYEEVIPGVGVVEHIPGNDEYVPATCEECGKAVTYCTVCHELLNEELLDSLDPALGHNYVMGVCNTCGDVYYEEFHLGENEIEIDAGEKVWTKIKVLETGWYCIFTDHSYPDLLLNVYDSEKKSVGYGLSSNNGTTKQTYSWVELVGGETYYIESYFYSEARSGSVKWNILDVTVESMDIDTCEIVENTNGSWQDYGYDSQYWSYKTTPWYTYPQLVVKYRSGAIYSGTWGQVCSEITNERGIFPNYNVINGIVQNYSNRLQIDETYTGSMRFDGYVVDYSVKIVETPVESISIESQDIKVNTNGYWMNYDTEQQYWKYYTNNAVERITVVYKDGRTYSGSLSELSSAVYDETGRYPTYSFDPIDQSYINQLEIGKIYTGILYFDGYRSTYDVRVVENTNVITSIIVDTEDVIEYTEGSWMNYGTDDQYWLYSFLEPKYLNSTLIVSYSDGLSFCGTWDEVMEAIKDEYGSYPSYYTSSISQSSRKPLVLGETYTGSMTLDGYTTNYDIRIVESPVKSVDIETQNIAEYTNGFWHNYGSANQYWCYFESSCITSLKIEYKDGRVYQGTLDEVCYEIYRATGKHPFYKITNPNGGSYKNPLKAGETYNINMSFDGFLTSYDMCIVKQENPVVDLVVEIEDIIEHTCGELRDFGTEQQYWDYYYNIPSMTNYNIWVTYADGRSFSGSFDDVNEEIYRVYGRYPEYRFGGIEQSYHDQLCVGESYTGYLSYDGYTTEYTLRIIESPVESIHIETKDIDKSDNGHWIDYGTSEQYWYYGTDPSNVIDIITVKYVDGSFYSGTWDEVRNAIKEDIGYYSSYSHYGKSQSYENQYIVGETYTETLIFDGYVTEYEIRIVEPSNPITSITIEPVEIIKNTNGYWMNSEEDEQYWHYNTELSHIGLHMVVVYNDGSIYSGTWKEVLNAIYEATGNDPRYNFEGIYQSYTEQLTVGEIYKNVLTFEGYTTEFDIQIVESPIESITIEAHDVIQNTAGAWENYGEEEQFWYYDTSVYNTISNITISYKDGSRYSGNWNDVYEEIHDVTGRYPDYYSNSILQSFDNQLLVGNSYTIGLIYDGYSIEYEIRIIDSPVASVQIASLEVFENTNGQWQNYGEPEQYWWYETHQGNNNIQISVIYKDGTSYSGKWHDVINKIENATGRRPVYNDIWIPQSYDHQLQVGELYSELLCFDGYITTYEVRVVETPIESIVIEAKDIIENTNGYWENYREPEQFWHYYTDPYRVSMMTVTYKDGSVYSGTLDEVRNAINETTGHYPEINYDGISQGYENQLRIGETYTGILTFDGYTTEYDIQIVENPNPVVSIVIEPIEIIENTKGYRENYGEPEQYWYYDANPYNVIENMTVNYADGSSYSGTWNEVQNAINEATGRYPEYSYIGISQSYSDPLVVGNTYTDVLTYDGYDVEYTVRIVANNNPATSIVIEPIEIIENTKGYWQNYGESEQYWYYYTEPYRIDMMTVTYKDGSSYSGTWDEVRNAINEATGSYPDYSWDSFSQSYENQLRVGRSYTGILTFDGYTTEYEVRIVEIPIESIVVETTEIVENTTGSWENYGEPEQYWYYYTGPDRIDVMTVTYKDGSVYSGTWYEVRNAINEATGREPEYSYDGISQGHENQLIVGETYTGILTFDGYTTDYTVRIVETPIESIVVETKHIIEYTNGMWQNRGESEQYWYYFTDPYNANLQMTVTYKDGRVYSGTWEEVQNTIDRATGKYPYYNYNDISQSYDNHLKVGETYTGTLMLEGYTTEYSIVILESPIESISVEPHTVIEGTNGYYQTSWNNGTTYWYYSSLDPQIYHVVMKNGETISGSSYDIYSKIGVYPSCLVSQTRYNETTGTYFDGLVAGEYTYEVSFLGKFCEYNVSIVESPIDHITVSPIRLIENYGGTMMEDGWYKYNLSYNGSVTVEITLKDGSIRVVSNVYISSSTLSFYLDTTRYELTLEDTQSVDNPWEKGSHYVTATLPDGVTTATLEYVVGATPVKDIILDEIVLYENLSGYMEGPENEKWFVYEIGQLSGWVILQDDTKEPIHRDRGVIYLDDMSYHGIELITDQSIDNQWGVGEHDVIVKLAGYQKTIKVNVLPCPVETIELFPITIVENQLGWWRYSEDGEEWFEYNAHASLSYEGQIIFSDGSTCMLSEAVSSGMIPSYAIMFGSGQSYENQWKVGENESSCTIGDIDYPITVIIEENPIKDITIDDFYLTEWENYIVDPEGNIILMSYDLCDLHVNIEMKDGAILQNVRGINMAEAVPGFIYKGQEYGVLPGILGMNGGGLSWEARNLEYYSADKPWGEWKVGDVLTFTAYIMGQECQFKVHFEPKRYTGLTIENNNGLVLVFSTEDGSIETMRATGLYLYPDGKGLLHTDKMVFSGNAEVSITFNGKTYGEILRENGPEGLKNVQISVGGLTSNVLEDASWFIEKLSSAKLNVLSISESISMANRAVNYSIGPFNGEADEDNIDFLIITAAYHILGYSNEESLGAWYTRSEEEVIEAISWLFGIGKNNIDLSMSYLYNPELKTVRIPFGFGYDGSVTEMINTENGTLIWNSLGVSALVNNDIIERITPYNGGICELADGDLWYVVCGLVQTQYTGVVEYDGVTYEIENGKVVQNDSLDEVTVQGCSLTLKGDIGLNFYLNLDTNLAREGAYAVFERNDIVSEPVLLSNVIHSGKQYKLTYHVSAKEMDDTIILRVYDGDGNLITLYKDGEEYAEGYSYSVNTYVELALSNNSVSDELKDLMRAMRQYGDCAQGYFGYGHPEGNDVFVDPSVFETYTFNMTSSSSKVSYYGTSLLLKDMTTIRHYFMFSDGIENYSITINGTNVSLAQKGDLYYVDIRNIAAQDLEEMPVVVITDTNGKEVYRLVYGVFSYADEVMNQDNNDQIKSLMAALYLYWQSAEVYFSKQ